MSDFDGSASERLGRLRFALGLAVALVPLTWLAQRLPPSTGLDPGWILGLNLARQTGLQHGSEILFTYGPLGWIARPQAFDTVTIAGYIAYVSLIIGVMSFVLSYTLAARYKRWVAAAATYAIMAAAQPYFLSELVMLIAFVLAMLVLQGAIVGRLAFLMPVVIAVIGGFQMTVKFGTGLVSVAIALMLALFTSTSIRQGSLRMAGTLGVGVGALVSSWLLAGQGLGTLSVFIVLSLELSTEYVEMATDTIAHAWEYVAAVGLLLAVTVAVVSARPTANRRFVHVGIVVLLVAMCWHMFRYGFIRHDAHSLAFYWFAALTVLVIQWRPRSRYVPFGIFAAALLVLAVGLNQPVSQLFDPTNNIRLFLSDARLVLSDEARNQSLAIARDAARSEYAAPDEVIVALADGPSHIDSYQTTFAWAYDIEWAPAPIFQTYSAYSDALDRRNADKLAAADGPRNILRRAESPIDNRYRIFETPRYTFQMLCYFSHEVQADTWQVVERNARSRCSEPVSIGVGEVEVGEVVSVPTASDPDAVVYAEIEVGRTATYSVLRRLFKPPPSSIILDGREFRIVANHLPGPLLLSIPDWDELPLRVLGIDGSDVKSVGVSGDGIESVRIQFYEVLLQRMNG